MPRFLFSVAAVAAMLWVDASFGQSYAQGRWCAVVSQGRGATREICHFMDFEACRLEVVSGNRGFCRPSQYWTGGAADVPRKAKRKRSKR